MLHARSINTEFKSKEGLEIASSVINTYIS